MQKRKTILITAIPILIGVLLPFSQAELPSWMCGPYTLCQVAERYGRVVDSKVVAKLAQTTEAGTTMKGLADAAYQLGMKVVGQKTTYQNLLQLTPPLIALVKTQDNANTNHFIIIDKVEQDQVEIWDVNRGYAVRPKKVFESIWDGYVLVISPPNLQQPVPVNAPDIEIDAPTHDFGTLPQMESAEHTFTIKNVGNLPLEILEVPPSCTCEKVTLKEKTIPPDSETELYVRYRGSTNSGKTRVAVYLKTKDERRITDTHSSPCQKILRQELRLHLQNAIADLTPTRKQVFLLYYTQDLSIKAIAARINRSEGTVKTHLRNARLQLQEYLTPYLKNQDIS